MPDRVQVAVIGGGPVGLATALVLSRFGIASVVLEREQSTTRHPKARGCNSRTMELFRQWGIEPRVRARGLPAEVEPAVVVESLSGPEIARVVPEPPDRVNTPAWTCHVTQDVVEEELYAAVARRECITLAYGSRAVSVRQDADQVEVAVQGADCELRRLRADYVVAADGAGSGTRRELGIDMVGPAELGVWATDFWRGDVSDLIAGRDAVSFIVVPPGESGPVSMLFPSTAHRYLTWTQLGPEEAADPALWTETRVRRAIATQLGTWREDIELLSQATWRMSSQIAARFREGRVFLAGDAAHRFPPTGGLGMNTGIQDAHNLAWKLAFVLKGWAVPRLLDTYETERRPIAQDNADWSVGNATRITELVAGARSGNRDRVGFWVRDMEHHIHQTGRALGFAYEQGALIPDGTAATPLNSRRFEPSDRPGARFPHLWLDLSRQRSTLEWFDTELTVVGGPAAPEWAEAAAKASASLGLPISSHALPWTDPDGPTSIGPRGAVLVRPDGHVMWRTSWLPQAPDATLTQAIARVLGL